MPGRHKVFVHPDQGGSLPPTFNHKVPVDISMIII